MTRKAKGGGARREVEKAVDLGGRVPRHAPEIEASTLATMLVSPKHIDVAFAAGLRSDHFFIGANTKIAQAIEQMHAAGTPVDLQTLAQWLRDRDQLNAVGGIGFLAKFVDATPIVAHVEAYAKTLIELSQVRAVADVCQLAAAEAFQDTGPVQPWIESVEERVHAIVAQRHAGAAVQAYEVFQDSFASLMRDVEVGVPTGFFDVDELIGGMHGGELLIVAARPGMGKTSFVMNVATNVASAVPEQREDGSHRRPLYGVMVFSLEMPTEQLAVRMAASEARVDARKLRKRPIGVTPEEFDRLVAAHNDLQQLPMWFDDTAGITVTEMRSKVRARQREFDKRDEHGEWKQKLGLVVIDYLQLVHGGDDGDSREEQISLISRGLKEMAKALRVPVVALSQLNRATETRAGGNRRPQLSDLRESGAIEQDADVVVFIYRPEYYEIDRTSEKAQRMKGYAELLIAKQRNGPTGKVPVTFIEEYTRFENRARDAWRADED